MLEGKNVNLRVMEKDDLPIFTEWFSDPDVFGEYNPMRQMSRTEIEKMLENPSEVKPFIIEKKNGSKIGDIGHRQVGKAQEISYAVVPTERGKGYCSEAVRIMVDFLFLSENIVRIQAHADVRNVASHRVLEKAGFKNEGVERKRNFVNGEWRDACLYSILREEWKEPKMLTKTS